MHREKVGKGNRVFTTREWLEEAGLLGDGEFSRRTIAARYVDPLSSQRRVESESALRRLVEEYARENAELRIRIAELEERFQR